MLQYNGTDQSESLVTCFRFEAPVGCESANVTGLTAPMSTSIMGLGTFGEHAYDYAYEGKPVELFDAQQGSVQC